MPELPEVETVVRTLRPNLMGREIMRIEIRHEDVIHYPDAAAFVDRLQGRIIEELGRRGKYICISLDDGQLLSAHLRMTGRLLYADPKQELLPHTHVIMELSGGGQLRYADVRRFGGFWLLEKNEEDTVTGMQHLGIEPLSPGFDAEYLISKLGRRACPVKNGILDQSVIAGLGNIYADETCIRQIELDFIEGNARARGLYEKMGFRITGVKPDAIRMKDGSFVNEYMMIKRL